MNRRHSRPRTSRPTDLSPGPSEVGFEFLLWRYERIAAKSLDESLLGQVAEQLRLERPQRP